MAACRWVADASSLSFVCVMTDCADKQNKNEAVGQPFVDETLLTAAADIWDCV